MDYGSRGRGGFQGRGGWRGRGGGYGGGGYGGGKGNYNVQGANGPRSSYYRKYRPHQGHMSEQIRQFYDELYPSDISIENLDQQLRIWVAQFLENSLDMGAK